MKKQKIIFIALFTTLSLLLFGCSLKQNEQPRSKHIDDQVDTNTSTQQITPTPYTESHNTEQNNVDDINVNTSYKDLCDENEDILISFGIANSKKSASICISKDEQDYIIYRYGSKDSIELEYPMKAPSSWDTFEYSYYLRGGSTENEGLDLNYLRFDNGGYTYEIYEEYSSDSVTPTIGIKVTNQETHEETNILGDSDSLKGSLINLRDNTKIKTIE